MPERPDDQNDWINYTNLSEADRVAVRRRSRSNQGRLFASIGLIVLGVLLFLGNLGILPIHRVWIFWPVFLIMGGIGRLLSGTHPSTRLWGVFMILAGCLFLLSNLGVVHIRMHDGSWPLSLIFIAVGLVALFSVLEPSRKPLDGSPAPAGNLRGGIENSTESRVNGFAVLGSIKRRVETFAFTGGDLTTIFGSLEIDLRHCVIQPEQRAAYLNLTAVFGAAKLRVPQEWRIDVPAVSVLGSVEDKTVPPNTGQNAPTLVISGLCVFASIEIED